MKHFESNNTLPRACGLERERERTKDLQEDRYWALLYRNMAIEAVELLNSYKET